MLWGKIIAIFDHRSTLTLQAPEKGFVAHMSPFLVSSETNHLLTRRLLTSDVFLLTLRRNKEKQPISLRQMIPSSVAQEKHKETFGFVYFCTYISKSFQLNQKYSDQSEDGCYNFWVL